jgi:hypothetical protein
VHAELRVFRHLGDRVLLHTRLLADTDGAPLADLFTAKRWLG